MDKESFEDKIRQQLERYEAPYEKSYWKRYTRSYPTPGTAFWKLWWMPYVFSSLLFGTAWFWFGRDAQPHSTAEVIRDTVMVQQTVVTRDTLVVRDTVVFVWTENRQQRSGGLKPGSEDGSSAADGYMKRSELEQQSSQAKPIAADEGSMVNRLEQIVEEKQQQGADPKTTAEDSSSVLIGQPQKPEDNSSQSGENIKSNIDPETMPGQIDSIEMTDLAAANEHENKLRDAGIFLSAGPRLLSFSPFDYGNFDTRFGMFAGGAVQIDWHKWQLEAGLQYGQQLNEIDDLTEVPVAQLQNYPGYTALTSTPDEIGVLSSHLLMPVQLRYAVFDYRAWRIQITGGALGNVVLSELFEYYTESSDREVFNRTQAGRGGLQISHLNAGLGTSYQWRQNLELQAILNYYHPLRPLGLNRLEAGALSLQLGLNWLLLPR